MMAPGPVSSDDKLPIEEDLDDLDDFDIAGPEFRSINAAMDQLQLALDSLESQNAGIHEELLELLQSNREIRMSFNQEAQFNNGQIPEDSANEVRHPDEPSETCHPEREPDFTITDPQSHEPNITGGKSGNCDFSFSETALADLRLEEKSKQEDA